MKERMERRQFLQLAWISGGLLGITKLARALAGESAPSVTSACIEEASGTAISCGERDFKCPSNYSCDNGHTCEGGKSYECQNTFNCTRGHLCKPNPGDFDCFNSFRCPGSGYRFTCSGTDGTTGDDNYQFTCHNGFTDQARNGCEDNNEFLCDDFSCRSGHQCPQPARYDGRP